MKIKKSVALAAILMLSPLNSFAKDFKDVSKVGKVSWAYEYIYKLSEENIFSGFPDGTFKPNKAVSFLETLQILKSINNPSNEDIRNYREKYKNILNEYKIVDWARDCVSYCLDKGVITELSLKSAYKKGLLNGKKYPSRNTVALLFARSLSVSSVKKKNNLTYKDKDKIPSNVKEILPALIETGIFSKDGSDGYFNGSKFIRRSEMAVITYKSREYLKKNNIKPLENNDKAKDNKVKAKETDNNIENQNVNSDNNINNNVFSDESLKQEEDKFKEVIKERVKFKGKVTKIVDGGTVKYLTLDIIEIDSNDFILPKSIVVDSEMTHQIGDILEGTCRIEGQNLIDISLKN